MVNDKAESMAIEYARRWYNFSPDEKFSTVDDVIFHASKLNLTMAPSFKYQTERLCENLLLKFKCRVNI